MKKKHSLYREADTYVPLKKIFRAMKITLFVVLLSTVQLIASNVYSQNTRFTLAKENATIVNVLSLIEDQSEYYFLYNGKLVDVGQKVNIRVENQNLEKTLNELFKNTNITYKIYDHQVVLSPSEDASAVQQQHKSVSGKVTDTSGGSLPGVSVVVKGTTTGTITDANGNFTISNIPSNATLAFSFVGMKSQEISIGNKTTINVELIEDAIGIEEVVAIGYGTMKKSDLTGALSQVREETIKSLPSTNVMQALTGRSSGVQVLQNTGAPGASTSVRIRGTNSIKGSNEPLYVVDGFPVSNQSALNNSDIESIEILKDASATAIYGSRGANGVVLVTTKRGKSGKTKVDFESSYTQQTLRKKLDLMNANEYAQFYNIEQKNDIGTEYFSQSAINSLGKGTDWQDLVFHKAPIKTSALNVSGGNEKTQFSISGNIFEQDGIIIGSNYNRYSLHTNVNHEVSKKFSVTLSSTLSRLDTERKDSGGGSRGNSLISAAIGAPPTLSPYNDDGSYRVLSSVYPFVATDLINPLNFINEQTNHIKANIVLANAAMIYKPIPELTVKISGGIENRDDRTDNYTTLSYINSSGNASASTSQFTSILSENTINYNKTFNEKHNLSALAGFTYQDFVSTSLSGSGTGFLSDVYETYNLGAASTPGIPGSGYSKSVLFSYIGRINYSLSGKYLATISFRADGSSKYSEGNKWGYFPSGALAWRVSDENFLKDKTIISDLKLRTSWGLTGSQAIDAYATLSQLSAGKTVYNDALYTSFAPGTTYPGNLKWETTEQKDFGIDLGILKNRFSFTADYYIKNTRDLLNSVVLPSSLGYTSTIKNVGEVLNKGLELGLNANIFNGAFSWDISANISFNRNKVVKLYDGEDILGGTIGVVVINDVTNILREGRPIGQFWGYLEDGYDNNGYIKFKDLNTDGTIDKNDKTYIGNPNPTFIYGLNSTMSYKNFELTLFIQGSQGNDIFNASSIYTIDYGFGLNMPKEVFTDHWTPTNTAAKYPAISYKNTARVSDRFIENGSYLRLKNVQLAYNLPVRKLGINWLQNAQVYASGQNLLTLTKYSWWDPEINSYGGSNSTSQGIDHFSYPVAKSVTCGIRVGF